MYRTTLLLLCSLFYNLLSAQESFFAPVTGQVTINSCQGILYDNGGPQGNYANDSEAIIIIQGDEGSIISLDFSEFDLEQGFDFLSIYADNVANGEFIGNYTGNELPNGGAPIEINSDRVIIVFSSDFIITEAGFAMNFSCGVNDQVPVTAANFPSLSCSGTVSFADESTGFPNSWTWDFGDGNTSNQQNPTHTYTNPGSYTVSLTACNVNGCDTFVSNNPILFEPESDICTSGISLPVNGEITTNACSGILFDSGGPEGDYQEGSYGSILIEPITSAGINISFSEFNLGNDGDHSDALYIIDPIDFSILAVYGGDELPNGGQPISFDVPSIIVGFYSDHFNNYSGFTMYWESDGSTFAPQAAFTTESSTVPLNTPVPFFDESQNFPGSWLWNFGDGTTSELENPTHVYSTPGTYEVTLEVANCNSTDISEAFTIIVLPAPEIVFNPVSFDLSLESGTSTTQNVNICNVGDGPLVLDLSTQFADNDLGYQFSFTTNENGESFSWAITDESFVIVSENAQDYEANQSYTEQVSGLNVNQNYYIVLMEPFGVPSLEQFILTNTVTGQSIFEINSFDGDHQWFLLPPPMPLSGSGWLELGQTELTIAPTECIDIPVVFDATELFAGVYESSIVVQSNDINQGQPTIPVTLTVTGAPQISVSPQTLDFGEVQVGASASLNFTIENTGTDILTLAGLTSADENFVLSTATSVEIPPTGSQMVVVTFTPSAVDNYAQTLTLENNAGDPVSVDLIGAGIPSPSISVNPQSFEVELLAGADTTLITNISNSGAATLNYSTQSSSDAIGYLFEFSTDFFGSEFSWTLTNSADDIVLSSASEEYAGLTDYAIPLSGLLVSESYTLNLFDSFQDGALTAFRVSDLSTGATIVEGEFLAPENPAEMVLDLGSPTGNVLQIDPESGSVAVDDSQDVSIGISSQGMNTGTYNFDVQVSSNDPLQPISNVDITLYVIAPVETEFEATNTFACGLVPIEFNDLSINTATSWTWDFGDGNGSEEQNPTHLYEADGIYDVSLISCNSLGCDTLTKTEYIIVETDCYSANIPANHGVNVVTVCEGNIYDSGGPDGNYLEGSFGRIVISPPGASFVSITFTSFHYEEHSDFLLLYDGEYPQGNFIGSYTGNELEGQTITANSGVLTIIEDTDHFIEKSGFVAIFSCSEQPTAPIASFNILGNNELQCANEAILFTDQSSAEPEEWFWDFGDGTTSNEQNPAHIYAQSGTYTVQLTACNEIGCDTEVLTIDVSVDPDCIIENIPGEYFTQRYISACFGNLYDSGGPDSAHLEEVTAGVTIISPNQNIAIVFTEFDMSEEGMVYVYDGYNTSAPLLGVYTGSDLPEGGTSIVASGNVISVFEFSGANPNGNSGFALSYFCENSFGDPSDGIRVNNGEMCDGIMTFSTPEDMVVDSWAWDFGDGTTSSEAVVEHEFPHEGAYEITLTTCYGGDCTTYVTGVYSNKITPLISAPNTVLLGTEVTFFGMTENVTHWSWDFGNGTYADHSTPSITYEEPGEYEVKIHMMNMNVHETCDAEHTRNITIVDNGTTSTEDLGWEEVKVFPNPATNILNIDLGSLETDNVQLRIFSTDGRMIRQWDYFETVIPVNDLSAGSYILEIIKEDQNPYRVPFIRMQ